MDRDAGELLARIPTATGRSTSAEAGPLVVSADATCVDEIARLCASVAAVPDVVADPSLLRAARWASAPCVLVDPGQAADVAALRLRRRTGVILVGRTTAAESLWRRAVEIGADDVVMLPTDSERLVERLADAVSPAVATAAKVVGVV